MKNLLILLSAFICFACQKEDKFKSKGFQVSEINEEEGKEIVGLPFDSLKFNTEPKKVLLTRHPAHRLIPIFKVNEVEKRGKKSFFTGNVSFYFDWRVDAEGNQWNGNYIPGFEIVYGYNFLNVAHHNTENKSTNNLFERPVLIKNLYYPTLSKDTLNNQPVTRNYYLVSLYNEDTNKDGYLNQQDLRKLLWFDLNGEFVKELIPYGYSVMSSEYDRENDYMYVMARHDQNENGQMESTESINVFWIDLKNPEQNGLLYK